MRRLEPRDPGPGPLPMLGIQKQACPRQLRSEEFENASFKGRPDAGGGIDARKRDAAPRGDEESSSTEVRHWWTDAYSG
jgi:hypothetical protein